VLELSAREKHTHTEKSLKSSEKDMAGQEFATENFNPNDTKGKTITCRGTIYIIQISCFPILILIT